MNHISSIIFYDDGNGDVDDDGDDDDDVDDYVGQVREQAEECVFGCLWAECGFECPSSAEMVSLVLFLLSSLSSFSFSSWFSLPFKSSSSSLQPSQSRY